MTAALDLARLQDAPPPPAPVRPWADGDALQYFLPECDDLVHPDVHDAGDGGDAWARGVYAHELYGAPSCDGFLVSKLLAEKTRAKRARVAALGIHGALRLPRAVPVLGDCGAFGYVDQPAPPCTTPEILDYYTGAGFDAGVSVDHLIVTATEASKRERYELTLANAADFLREHRARGLPWTPLGAVQGWDPASYAEAARQVAAMGYDVLGIGGLVRTPTRDVVRLLDAVHAVVPARARLHLFGLARLDALEAFRARGVASVDSTSYLRRAWTGGKNYFTLDGEAYAALRIPEAGKSFRAKRMVADGRAGAAEAAALERSCLAAVRAYDRGACGLQATLDALVAYDRLITPDRADHTAQLRRTLEARPWQRCACAICARDGVEVIIFRGNNRNRRRGFHNTWVFRQLFARALAGEGPAPRFDDDTEEDAGDEGRGAGAQLAFGFGGNDAG